MDTSKINFGMLQIHSNYFELDLLRWNKVKNLLYKYKKVIKSVLYVNLARIYKYSMFDVLEFLMYTGY